MHALSYHNKTGARLAAFFVRKSGHTGGLFSGYDSHDDHDRGAPRDFSPLQRQPRRAWHGHGGPRDRRTEVAECKSGLQILWLSG